VNDGAELITSSDAVRLRTDSEVNLYGTALIKTTTFNDHNLRVESDSSVTLNGSSSLRTDGLVAFGVFGDGSIELTLNDSSHITTAGDGSDGVLVTYDDNVISLTGTSYIKTAGNFARGIYSVWGENAVITLSGSSAIETQGKSAFGVYLFYDDHSVILNDSAHISTSGETAHGVFVYYGDDALVTLNGTSSIVTTGSGANAVRFRHGSNTLINNGALSSSNAITVFGDDTSGESDTISNYGIITSGIGVAISLNAGNDSLTLGTGSNISGGIDGGAGTDMLKLVGTGSEDDEFTGFETLSMEGSEWELSEDNSFDEVTVVSGVLTVNSSITAPSFAVESAGTLAGNGTIAGSIASSGAITPGNSIGTLTIDGDFTQTGGSVEIEFDENEVDLIHVTGATILEGNPTLFVMALNGATSGSGVILRSDGGVSGTFGTIVYEGYGSANLSYSANEITLTVIDPTTVVGQNLASLQTALTLFDEMGAEQLARCEESNEFASGWRISFSQDCRSRLWARGFAQWGNQEASAGNRSFSYQMDGIAFGADGELTPGLRLGASLGRSFTDEVLAEDVSETSASGVLATLHAALERKRGFATATLGLGHQTSDLSRLASVTGTLMTAEASTDGWLLGGRLEVGLRFEPSEGFMVTPSGSLSYLHQWIDGYDESGAAAGNVEMGEHDTGALRLRAKVEADRRLAFDELTIEPHVKIGIAQDLNDGGTAEGQFSSSGYEFELRLDDNSHVRALAGTGVKMALGTRIIAQLCYEGEFSDEKTVHAIVGGARIIW
jgi:uncharacterized protein with beta-barrel porin domain